MRRGSCGRARSLLAGVDLLLRKWVNEGGGLAEAAELNVRTLSWLGLESGILV